MLSGKNYSWKGIRVLLERNLLRGEGVLIFGEQIKIFREGKNFFSFFIRRDSFFISRASFFIIFQSLLSAARRPLHLIRYLKKQRGWKNPAPFPSGISGLILDGLHCLHIIEVGDSLAVG
ncbi:MAG: hypothetical protein J5698_02940, partial [Bacteroidaceae bacterium]|nr:hypothetical protein [Bacteroidaceae bacterium]